MNSLWGPQEDRLVPIGFLFFYGEGTSMQEESVRYLTSRGWTHSGDLRRPGWFPLDFDFSVMKALQCKKNPLGTLPPEDELALGASGGQVGSHWIFVFLWWRHFNARRIRKAPYLQRMNSLWGPQEDRLVPIGFWLFHDEGSEKREESVRYSRMSVPTQ